MNPEYNTYFYIAGAAVLGLAGFIVLGYNGLIMARNRFRNAFAQIDVQLKRRYDLIPNLVETAKAYMKHERETLEAVINARNIALAAYKAAIAGPAGGAAIAALGGAESALSSCLSRLMVVSEAYPALKADDNMRHVSEELVSTENRVAFSRQAYNNAVMDYNNKREVFPWVIIAGLFRFAAAELFQVASAPERDAPKVSF